MLINRNFVIFNKANNATGKKVGFTAEKAQNQPPEQSPEAAVREVRGQIRSVCAQNPEIVDADMIRELATSGGVDLNSLIAPPAQPSQPAALARAIAPLFGQSELETLAHKLKEANKRNPAEAFGLLSNHFDRIENHIDTLDTMAQTAPDEFNFVPQEQLVFLDEILRQGLGTVMDVAKNRQEKNSSRYGTAEIAPAARTLAERLLQVSLIADGAEVPGKHKVSLANNIKKIELLNKHIPIPAPTKVAITQKALEASSRVYDNAKSVVGQCDQKIEALQGEYGKKSQEIDQKVQEQHKGLISRRNEIATALQPVNLTLAHLQNRAKILAAMQPINQALNHLQTQEKVDKALTRLEVITADPEFQQFADNLTTQIQTGQKDFNALSESEKYVLNVLQQKKQLEDKKAQIQEGLQQVSKAFGVQDEQEISSIEIMQAKQQLEMQKMQEDLQLQQLGQAFIGENDNAAAFEVLKRKQQLEEEQKKVEQQLEGLNQEYNSKQANLQADFLRDQLEYSEIQQSYRKKCEQIAGVSRELAEIQRKATGKNIVNYVELRGKEAESPLLPDSKIAMAIQPIVKKATKTGAHVLHLATGEDESQINAKFGLVTPPSPDERQLVQDIKNRVVLYGQNYIPTPEIIDRIAAMDTVPVQPVPQQARAQAQTVPQASTANAPSQTTVQQKKQGFDMRQMGKSFIEGMKKTLFEPDLTPKQLEDKYSIIAETMRER